MVSARHFGLVRKRSENRAAASGGRDEDGKYCRDADVVRGDGKLAEER